MSRTFANSGVIGATSSALDLALNLPPTPAPVSLIPSCGSSLEVNVMEPPTPRLPAMTTTVDWRKSSGLHICSDLTDYGHSDATPNAPEAGSWFQVRRL